MVEEKFKFPHDVLAERFAQVCSKVGVVHYRKFDEVYTSAETPVHAQLLIIASCLVAGWELAMQTLFTGDIH